MNIKEYIINNFKGDKKEDISLSINESISSSDEVVLPGMGVLFTLLWEDSSNDMKDKILDILEKKINQN